MGYFKLPKSCRMVLQVEEDFHEDFCFKDVAKEMERVKVFSADECRSIMQEDTEEERTEKMLFLLMYKKDKDQIETFKEVLLKDYDWLSEKIDQPQISDENFLAYEKCFRDSNIPNNRSGVVYRTNLLWEVRKILKSLKECNYLVLHGNTGSGKRWLAIDACCDYRVIRAMNYKIFWLNVTDCVKPEKILNKMEHLKVMMLASLTDKELIEMDVKKNGYVSMEAKMEAERNDLRNIVKHESLRNCLLVLSDLKDDMTQKAFDLHCKILVTTRNLCSMSRVGDKKKRLLSTSCGLTENECCCLFEKSLGRPTNQNELRNFINEIYRVINGSPDLAAKIAKNLLSIYDGDVVKRLKEWIRCLGDCVENNRTMNVMEESLKVLTNDEVKLYMKLAIFPPNCLIPIPVLMRYFQMNAIQVGELVRKFEKYSLLELDFIQTSSHGSSGQEMMCRIHFICAQFLTGNFRKDLGEFHREIVYKYKIEEVLEKRREPNFLDFPNDHYFYTFIGYHLCEGKLFDLFVKLFCDFGFLEIKVRESGLTNTIGDFKLFQEKSGSVSPIFDQLQYFLPNVEERIYHTKDLTLLQQALGGTSYIGEAAREQLLKYPERIWFRMNCGEKWRKIVQLNSNPIILRFLPPHSVLVAQRDNRIVQIDLTNNLKCIPNLFSGHEKQIIQMEIFSESYLISLDASGVLYYWYVGRDYERIAENGNRRQFAGHTNYTINDAYKFDPLQKIQRNKMNRIVCFHIFSDETSLKLLCALVSGQIIAYNWTNEEFIVSPSENFSTNLSIKCLQYIGQMKLLVLDTKGQFHCFNLKNNAETGFNQSPREGTDIPIAIHFNLEKLIYCVFPTRIVLIKIEIDNHHFLTLEFTQEIYKVHPNTSIECSALAKNGNFLVLGTKTGIIVFDCERQAEVQQKCVTEHVACIDVFTSHEIIVIYGNDCKKNIAKIFEINVTTQSPESLQHHLFEVIDNDCKPILYAVDTNHRIHEYNILDTKEDVIKVSEKQIKHYQPNKITAIARDDRTVIFGCDDGSVFEYSNTIWKQIACVDGQVEFVKYINSVLVVGTNSKYNLQFKDPHEGAITNCYAINDDHLLVMTKGFNFNILNVNNNQIISNPDCEIELNLEFCDYAHPYLMTCGEKQEMCVYTIEANGVMSKLRDLSKKCDSTPTSMAVSSGKDFFAVGFLNGNINIYDIGGNFKYLQTLESHKSAVTYLAFSPWNEANWPQILISLGEQICFWNIGFVVNNVANGNKANGRCELSERTNGLTIGNKSPWDGKIGAAEKPELLSCVKFAGNTTTKLYHDREFTKFLTIDNEGEIHVLILNDCEYPTFR